MMFSGTADWNYLERAARQATIPVIGSGDLNTPLAARQALKRPGIAGLMLGRGALGRPWLFDEIRKYTNREKVTSITWSEKLATIFLHWKLLEDHKGEKTGFLLFRKHLAWYSRGLPGAAAFRQRVFATSGKQELTDLVQMFFDPFTANNGKEQT